MRYLYYPGCSLKSTGRAYEESLLAVFEHLGTPLYELRDWNCCGATAYMSIDELKAFALAARNLALAERQNAGEETVGLVAPCSACYLVLNKAQRSIEEYAEIGRKVSAALQTANLQYEGRVRVRHPLHVLVNDIGLEPISQHVKRPLNGLRVACYYGCQIVRPYANSDDPHTPMTMDRLMQALGAETIDWPLKTRCCGGSLTGTIPEVGLRLNYIVLREALKRGAEVVATACPLCQFNLECYQDKISRQFKEHLEIPVVYFTQLLGLALGIPERRLGMHRLLVPMPTARGGAHTHA